MSGQNEHSYGKSEPRQSHETQLPGKLRNPNSALPVRSSDVDPLAELMRLINDDDPFASVPQRPPKIAPAAAPSGYDPALHPAADLEQEPTSDPSWEAQTHATDWSHGPTHEHPGGLQPVPHTATPRPAPVRSQAEGSQRKGLVIAAALLGFAVLGGGVAVVYRTVSGSAGTMSPLVNVDKQPTGISPPNPPEPQGDEVEPQRVRTTSVQADGIIVREDRALAAVPAEPVPAIPVPNATEPQEVTALSQLVKPVAQPVPTASALSPANPMEPNRTKLASPDQDAAASMQGDAPASSTPWSVQLRLHRSDGQARSALTEFQKKHQALLGRHEAQIAKVELGSKGAYYRVQFAVESQATANKLCSGLKAVGASCWVQRN